MRAAMAVGALVLGFGLGLVQPMYKVSVGVVFAFGPTIVGLILMLSILMAVIFGIGSLVPRWRVSALPTFILGGSLAVGIIGGNWVGGTFDIGLHAEVPRGPLAYPSYTPIEFHQAPGTVELQLEDEPAYVVTVADPAPEPYKGGLFGHWCSSMPNSAALRDVAAMEVGELNGLVLSVHLWLPESAGRPRIVLQILNGEAGVVPVWAGEGRTTEREGSGGRVTFEDLPADPPLYGWPRTLTGELSWECAPWQDGER